MFLFFWQSIATRNVTFPFPDPEVELSVDTHPFVVASYAYAITTRVVFSVWSFINVVAAVTLVFRQVRESEEFPFLAVSALVLESLTSFAVLVLVAGGPAFSTTTWPFYFVVFGALNTG